VGLEPTLAAIERGLDIALANKEALVMAGELVMERAKQRQVRILPIDSEHSALFQALEAGRRQDVTRLILTASGGPFRTRSSAEMEQVDPREALAHPNWDMGAKISIDSATLMNKGLEVIEACHLFDMPVDQVDVVVHPQSVIHSMVEYIDGSVLAQLGIPDMRIPIAYALSYPERLPLGLRSLCLAEAADLSFEEPDVERFPCLELAYAACRMGGTAPAILNAANEEAVAAFLTGKIKFADIPRLVALCLERLDCQDEPCLEDILAADQEARCLVNKAIAATPLPSLGSA
jgi:1-deoxy-D-xylulose-5-phosphate reductoisomerase